MMKLALSLVVFVALATSAFAVKEKGMKNEVHFQNLI
jgi:hypothetical protein